ncbi:MAG: hypothetical protein KGV44_12000 [Flavobacteriaceae bacterium]|nr:hypothetical protein [Flavobacteriaceae bacterium]
MKNIKFACPCCGYKTLNELYNVEQGTGYAICQVCWWEDDGRDNHNADEGGSPNQDVENLIMARCNFLKFGISCPSRTDLMHKRHPKENFEKGRFFEIENNYIMEKGTFWKVKLANN